MMEILEHLSLSTYLGDNERVVHCEEVPVHIWRIRATQSIIREEDGGGGGGGASAISRIVNKEQYLLAKETFNVRYEELISDYPGDSILDEILEDRGVGLAERLLMIRKVATLARSMRMPIARPIFIVVAGICSYISRRDMELALEDIWNRAVNAAIRESMEEEEVRVVPAAKSSIDGLEKVKAGMDDVPCSICFQEFEDDGEMEEKEEEEIVRMPCSHVYHTRCLVKWLEYNHVCPLCRFELPVD